MDEELKRESELLAGSWERHDPDWLREYLVSGVEDPRINLQSILTRHFLIRAVAGERFADLMRQEYLFSAAMNWLLGLDAGEAEKEAVLHALRRGADNAEGLLIPPHAAQAFIRLPSSAAGATIPNYIEAFLKRPAQAHGTALAETGLLSTFCGIWSALLATMEPADLISSPPGRRPTVLEPACGSANDYRYLDAFGIGRLIEYTGSDVSAKNIANARALFPGVAFQTGNVFELQAPDQAFDFGIVQDLFEHLSLRGLSRAVSELCRVTRRGLCAGFFQMEEIPAHIVRPVEDYYWNRLSMDQTRELFASHGFVAQVIHADTFLRQQTGCESTHNPQAYTFLLARRGAAQQLFWAG